MALTDREIATKIVCMESDIIGYREFDSYAGIDHLDDDANKQSKRASIVKRVNTILKNGIDGSPHAFRLHVESNGISFRRVPLQESALEEIRIAKTKILKRADTAIRLAAFSLQRKSYYSLTDRKNIALRKLSPEIDSGHRSELEQAEKALNRSNRMLEILFEDIEEHITTIDRLTGGSDSRKSTGFDLVKAA